MMWSRWRPDRGGYDYYESAEGHGLGDDLPVPKLPRGTLIGVASTEAGRTPISPLRPVGHGPAARGLLLPLDRSALGVLSSMWSTKVVLGVGIVIGAIGTWLWRRRSKR